MKSFPMLAASSLVAAYTFMLFTGWHFTSALANEIVGSVTVGAYSLSGPIETEHIAGTLFVNKVRWDAGAMGVPEQLS